MLVRAGVLTPLSKYDNCFLARTDPRDVARTEGRTYLSTKVITHLVINLAFTVIDQTDSKYIMSAI